MLNGDIVAGSGMFHGTCNCPLFSRFELSVCEEQSRSALFAFDASVLTHLC